MSVKLVKARKKHICENCQGEIQIGEIYKLEQYRSPLFDGADNQVGVNYGLSRTHNRDCMNFLRWANDPKMFMRNCSKGIHKKTWSSDPDSDDSVWCEWCGEEL